MPTIAEQLTQLTSDRDDLVDNLTTQGISGLTGDETFTELVPEVLNISGGGGADLSEYIDDEFTSNASSVHTWLNLIKKLPTITISNNVTSLNYMFRYCKCETIPTIIIQGHITDFSHMFNSCNHLTTIPQLNTSSGTNFNNMFNSCSRLETIPTLDVSSGTNFNSMFYMCYYLTAIPQLDMSSGTNVSSMFQSCSKLTSLGGFTNLGQAYLTTQSANYFAYTLTLSVSTLLTHDSLMNVINNLYDIATKGCNTQRLTIGSTNLAKLTAEEIATATSKGWSIS